MKTTAKNAIREEGGKILILVLVLLVVGGLLLGPLLGLMSTGLVAGQVYEKKAAELYAADAGVEAAVWAIQADNLTWAGNYSELNALFVNAKNVTAQIYRTKVDGSTHCHIVYLYQILSVAEGQTGSATSVEAVLKSVGLNYTGFAGNAITSGANVLIQPVSGQNQLGEVCGHVSLPPDRILNPTDYRPGCGGTVKRENLVWPNAEEIAEFYWDDVKNAVHYYSDTTIDLNGINATIGPLYVDGKLTILNSSDTPATLKLTGTLYSTGDTQIGVHGKKNLTLHLARNAIFVESGSRKPPKEALQVADRCDIKGPGSIIAVGDIYFAPNAQIGGEESPILLMSLSGSVDVQPGSTFYGSVNGRAGVQLQPNNTIRFPPGWDPFTGINFPGFIEGKERYTLESWEIK